MNGPGTTRERVIGFLEHNPDRHLCVACIARALGVPHKAVHTATLKIEAGGRASRSYRRCASCGKIRLGITVFSERFAEEVCSD